MTPRNRTAILTRVNQGLAGAALMTGLALSGAVASAVPVEWDIEKYDECMRGPGGTVATCCWESGGVVTDDGKGGEKCQAQTLEGQPGETGAPPGLQNPPGQIAPPPVITVPRGPNSGTMG
jgi:hypothetical protein